MTPSTETEIGSLNLNPLKISHLVPGTIIPENTIVKGRLIMVWGQPKSSNPSSQSMIPRIAFTLSAQLSTSKGDVSGLGNDYISNEEKEKEKEKSFHIKFTLYHSNSKSDSDTSNEISNLDLDEEMISKKMQEERNRLEGIMTKSTNLTVRCDGFKVLMVENKAKKAKGKGMGKFNVVDVFLEGYGKRLIILNNNQSFTLLNYGTHNHKINNTPAWLDSSTPELSSPFQSQSQTTPIPAPLHSTPSGPGSGPEPSRLRPITTYPVPSLPIQTQPQSVSLKRSKSSTSTNTSTSINDENDNDRYQLQSINTGNGNGDGDGDETQRHQAKKPRTSLPDISRISSSDENVVNKESPQTVHVVKLGPVPLPTTPDVFTAPRPCVPRTSSGLSVSETHSPLSRRSPSTLTSRRVSFPNRTPSKEAEGSVGRELSEEDALRERRKVVEAAARQKAQEAQAESSRVALERTQTFDSLNQPFTVGASTYTPLRNLGPRRHANVIGVVVKSTSAKRTSKGDWTMSVVIADPSRYANDAMSSEEFVVSIFRAKETELPDPAHLQAGTVILFRGLVISLWNNKTKGQAYTSENIGDNTWAILLDNHHQKVKLANPRDMQPALTKIEVERMLSLKKWWSAIASGGGGGGGGGGTSEDGGRRSVTPSRRSSYGVPKDQVNLGQVRPNQFYDGTFKILYVTAGKNGVLELYVTDGTRSSFSLRNFHNITEGLPLDAVHSISIMNEPPDSIKHYFEKGNCLKMCNLRPKLYKGELEHTWSELPTEDQLQKGWRNKNCYLLNQDDDRVQLIERRIKALKRGEELPPEAGHLPADHALEPMQYDSTTRVAATTVAASTTVTREHIELATHLSTIYKDDNDHPINTISEILSNPTVPNKYRLRARVKSIHSRGLQGTSNNNDQYVQKYCKHCKRAFKDKNLWCKSCNDTNGLNAEWRYRFVIVLEQEDEKGEKDEMAVIVADDDAALFLPALPPYSTSSNPNDIKKTEERRKQITNETKTILLGAPMNGVRPRSLIDFSLISYLVTKPTNGQLHNANLKLESEKEKDGVVVFKVFGMKGL